MATPPNSTTAYAQSLANLTAIQLAANNAFISDSAQAIANAIPLGQYDVVLTTTKDCDIASLQLYFTGLGYHLFYLDLPNPNLNPYNPAELFGQFYYNYWQNNNIPYGVHNPQRIKISWNPPNTLPWPNS